MRKHITFLSLLLVLIPVCSMLSVSAARASDLKKEMSSPYMILVNRSSRIAENYVPDNLVTFSGSSYKLERTCAAALSEMINACAQNGGQRLILYSGYRSYQSQHNKYYGKINQYKSQGYSDKQAHELTDRYYAPPGGSEHHTGLAADICIPSVVNQYGMLHESFANTSQGKWLRNNAHCFGFILRYDSGKEGITGYNYEPWHFRYVGVKHATAIYSEGLTYEEYYTKLQGIVNKVGTAPKAKISGNSISFTAPAGVTLRYTANGKTPTAASPKLTGFLSGKDVTYKVISCFDGYTSPAATLTVTKYGDIFTDILKKDWHYDYVSETVNVGLYQGLGNYTFAPNKTMTRAMLVQVLANLSGINLNAYNGKTEFRDVPRNKWYAPAIQWASDNNVVHGMGGGMFAPDSPITREQTCVIIYNHSKKQSSASLPDFTDRGSISSWAKAGVSFCASKNIVSGYPDGSFKPQASATRAEVAKIALTYYKL